MISAIVHATCIVCNSAGTAFGAPADAGVLITGDSGSGKSDLALRLIAMGAGLVADDSCELFKAGETLQVRAARNIRGLMEVRGVGIVAMPFVPEARIALVVATTSGNAIERLPIRRTYMPPAVLQVSGAFCPPQIAIDPRNASAPAKILAAVAAFERSLLREEALT